MRLVGLDGQPVTRTDQALIQACIDGNASAWDEFVDRFGRLVYSIPRRHGLSAADSDDVFQTVFAIVLRRLETLRSADRVSAWLIRTTHRECWRVGRRRQSGGNLSETLADEALPTEEQVSAWERQHLVRQALAQIDDRCRRLLEALYFQQAAPDYAEIAKRLDMKIGSVGPTRARCLAKLQPILRRLTL